jgi:hypothetical protein
VLRQRVLRLSREVYPEFNDTHFTEKLGEEEGIVLSRETVRQIRRGGRIEPKRRRRAKKHRRRRERMSQEGWMVLWDGSPHLWLGEGYPACCLMAAMDDATGRVGCLPSSRIFSSLAFPFTPFRAPFDRDANIAPMSRFVKENFCPQDAVLRPGNFRANGLIISKKCAKGNLEGRAVWILLN